MGKSLPAVGARLHQLTTVVSSVQYQPSNRFPRSRLCLPGKPDSKADSDPPPPPPRTPPQLPPRLTPESRTMESSSSDSGGQEERILVPLSQVVSECVRRWFHDSLKDAKAGDVSMQVLVGQMYYSGYGVARDPQKGRMWITRAARCRSSAWKVSDKRPGYNVSDSDSDELQTES